jgi:pimeloyl-ACP methyl ester carboxylesterase
MYRFPPKLEASVLGETIEYVCAGSGPCAVVLVNGAGGPIEGWHKVFDPLARFSRVFAYNRPGAGKSSKPKVPQVGSRMVASLRAVLQAANVAPPYVLVGHSLGGLIVNLFARLHRTEVSAAALLEATAVDDVAALAAHENALQRLTRRVLDRLVPPDPHAETRHIGSTVSELQLAPAFPTIPLRVVTGAKRAMAWAMAPEALAARATHQQELAALSPLGKQVIAVRSGHFPQFTEPELVVAAIAQLLTASDRNS